MKRFITIASIFLTLLITISFSIMDISAMKIKREKSTTVKDANGDIYEKFISYSGDLLSSEEINKKIKSYGTYSGNRGMLLEEFKETMANEWVDVTFYKKVISQYLLI